MFEASGLHLYVWLGRHTLVHAIVVLGVEVGNGAVVQAGTLDDLHAPLDLFHLVDKDSIGSLVVSHRVVKPGVDEAMTQVALAAYTTTALNVGSTAVEQFAYEEADASMIMAAVVEASHETLLGDYQAVAILGPSERCGIIVVDSAPEA